MTLAFIQVVKFIHIVGGMTFTGLVIASFFYIAHGLKQRDAELVQTALHFSRIADWIILPIIVFQLATAALLVNFHHYTIHVPWIFVAYHGFVLLIVLWFLTVRIKCCNRGYNGQIFRYKKWFYALNIIIILMFAMIIHDAVMQTTWFAPLFPGVH